MKTKLTNYQATNYQESAAALSSESSKADLKRIREVYKQFDKSARSIKDGTVDAANRAREIGLLLQTLCGHEQITFLYWQDKCEGKLPFKFENAKIFMGIARRMPAKAKTLAEAVPFVQQLLIADGALSLAERTDEQTRGAVSIEQRFLSELTLMRQPFQKIIRNTPMERWPVSMLDNFLAESQWLADEREKALRLKAGKV